MSCFLVTADGKEVRLELTGEVTIEQAGELHRALSNVLREDSALVVDFANATKLDLAALQILIAARKKISTGSVTAPAPLWQAALSRFGLDDPLSDPCTHSSL